MVDAEAFQEPVLGALEFPPRRREFSTAIPVVSGRGPRTDPDAVDPQRDIRAPLLVRSRDLGR